MSGWGGSRDQTSPVPSTGDVQGTQHASTSPPHLRTAVAIPRPRRHSRVRMARTQGPLGESWQAWVALAVGVVAISAHTASSMTFAVLMKPILGELGWQRTDFAAAMTLRMSMMVLVLVFAGLYTDRLGARVVLTAGALIIGFGNFALSAIRSLPELYGVMALLGPGQAAIGSVAASALVLRRFRHRRSIAIGILNGGDNLLNSGIYLAAAGLLAWWGWRATIATLAGAYLVLAGLILVALRPDAETERTTPRNAIRLRDVPWRDSRLWVVCLTYAGIYAFITSVQLHLHAHVTDLGFSPTAASGVLSTLTLVGALGAPLFGVVAERTSARAALLAVVIGLTIAAGVLGAIRELPAFTAWAIGYGLVNSGVVALLTLVLAELFGAEPIGRLMGVAMVACMSATMAGNLFSAGVFDRTGSYALAWQAYAVLMIAVLFPTVWLWRLGTGAPRVAARAR